jgi:hypothetical protein
MRSAVLVAVLVLPGCEQLASKSGTPAASTKEPAATLVGIWPKEWTCDRIATAAEIGGLLGGTAREIDSPVSPPDGVARPCNYLVELATGPESWTFDVDCRDSYRAKADALFAQYTEQSAEQVQHYNAASDAAPTEFDKLEQERLAKENPDAAPVVRRAPEAAHEVPIGARGLDHHGQGLLFIDDDAPCYVRIVGPDADRRLALARHVVSRLAPATAPMTPRAAPR